MGDRNIPIKFGPEWLRNLALERSSGNAGSNSQSAHGGGGSTSLGGTEGTSTTSAPPGMSVAGPSGNTGSSSSALASGASSNSSGVSATSMHAKVLLAKLRYGKEEMLALYDRNQLNTSGEVRYSGLLYESREKPPLALNDTFDQDMRDTLRPPPVPTMPLGERAGIGRGRGLNVSDGRGRGLGVNNSRGRARMPFLRQTSVGRGSWHLSTTRMPNYSGGAGEDSSSLRQWGNSNNARTPSNRNGAEQTVWSPSSRLFRGKRLASCTNNNWRQSSREEAEEWRNQETNRPRPSHQERRGREWGDRPNQEKQWNANRPPWVGGDTHNNDENLPEWAIGNAEAGAGTFDSSGAFHGYSNDDPCVSKTPETPAPLCRSHTFGNLSRAKTAEEGSEEWWASEKANKLLPKKFDAGDMKGKKVKFQLPGTGEPGVSSISKSSTDKEEHDEQIPEKLDKVRSTKTNPLENENSGQISADNSNFSKQQNAYKPKFTKSTIFEKLMRSEIDRNEANDERSNFQSVMIAPNNSLRQKHQNIVAARENIPTARDNTATRDSVVTTRDIDNNEQRKSNLHMSMMQKMCTAPKGSENDQPDPHQSPNKKIVDEIMEMTLEDKEKLFKLPSGTEDMNLLMNTSSAMAPPVSVMNQMPNPSMPMGLPNPNLGNPGMSSHGLSNPGHLSNAGFLMNPNPNMLPAGLQRSSLQLPIQRMPNAALNAALGLPIRSQSNTKMGMGMPLQNVPPPVVPNTAGLGNHALGTPMQGSDLSGMQSDVIPIFPNTGLHGIPNNDISNNSLFMGQNPNFTSMPSVDIPMPNHVQNNVYPMHGLAPPSNQPPYGSSLFSDFMQQAHVQAHPVINYQNMADQWYYEDPKKIIQGPFSSKDMYSWYKAGYFKSSLMVRRSIDAHMRPLGSYGPVVPFAQMEYQPPYPLITGTVDERPELNWLSSPLGLGKNNIDNVSGIIDSHQSFQIDSMGRNVNPPYGLQQNRVESLWSQPTTSDMLWMQHSINPNSDPLANNVPMYYWDQQQSTAIGSNSRLPDEIAKEMKTEDQILAQLRASQNISSSAQTSPFINEQLPSTSAPLTDENKSFSNAVPKLEDLQKLLQQDATPLNTILDDSTSANETSQYMQVFKSEKAPKIEQPNTEQTNGKTASQNKHETKPIKPSKNEVEKSVKVKEVATSKSKKNKPKDEKKEDNVEFKAKEEESSKSEKHSQESSPTKGKKEEKINKKDHEKEKKEWIKEGFTIVKGVEKPSKESKKKAEELRVAEEIERKRKEEEKLAAEEDKKRKQSETAKALLDQQHQQRQAEFVAKKAPWSAMSAQASQSTDREGLTLAEIQRLEREKKLEQMKEQQQMMQLIAQQQAAALAREQEMQAGLGWAKKKMPSSIQTGQSLAEIQAEARKAASAAAAAAVHGFDEARAPTPPQVNHVPWGAAHNGGFWDTQPNQGGKPIKKPTEIAKSSEPTKTKKKSNTNAHLKREASPAAEFDNWCNSVLKNWSSKIDVPTFVGFLKDIESPYEVKDYVKCYLGESKDTNDFARNFLERRSKLLRVGMTTPSDDLCSPAVAVNPRTLSGSEYQEVNKGKGKKSKKKMLKVDARILGFSVTASEDRINVGDMDTV